MYSKTSKSKELELLIAQLEHIQAVVSELGDKVNRLHSEIVHLKKCWDISSNEESKCPSVSGKCTPHIMERNVKQLQTLTCGQVSKVINFTRVK